MKKVSTTQKVKGNLKDMKTEALKEAANNIPTKHAFIADEFKADETEEKAILKDTKKEKKVEPKKEIKTGVKSEPKKDVKKGPSLIDVLTPMIEKGKFTKKELIPMTKEILPHLAESTISTILTDSKNPKYNKFARLTEEDEKKVFRFKKTA